MSTSEFDERLEETNRQLDRVIDAVVERGYDDISEDCDDYSTLIETFEFRKLVTLELYEAYFLPRRHEFELQLLGNVVDAVASNQLAMYLACAAVSGVVGNAVYDLLKRSLAHAVYKLETVKRSRDAFQEIQDNLDVIRTYFQNRDQVNADKLYADLGLKAHKVEPLLKLLGFRCHRRKKRKVWSKPASW